MFDVVVVGGGAAGCVVASRLSESASRSVLLLEAGPDLRTNLPGDLRDGWRITRDFDWGFMSEPDERGVVENLWRDKLLGGTSWVTRFAVRGSPADYDEWEALGNAGWSFQDVLPYFKRLEADADFGDQPWHGDSGPIPIDRYHELPPTDIGAASLRALEAVGFPFIEDHNRPGAVGAGRMPMSSRDGLRVTTADAYLPIGHTPQNLTIRPDTHVSDIVFDGTRARGVRLVDGTVVRASWVVLSAGTYGSPSILMRSGIGQADHLQAIGIPVLLDLPGVGANLADHPAVDIDPGYRGAARDAPVLHSIATFHSGAASSDAPPDLMLWVADPRGTPPEFSIDVVLLKPRSRGTVRLRSADPTDPPRIDLPDLREGSDVERLAEAYLRAWEVASRPEIRHLCADMPPEIDAEDLRGWIRANSYSNPHVVGTCSMGPSPDDGAVVDASGRVHGTEQLSVVDASIMPDAPSGFPHIPTIMIAERLSEQIASLL
ncbi:MAG: GMC family oxidoreductase N-terminal domain-containing protein [Actinobacteria bacterium]|nr:GMC family oxidoreductase N-terminal domain-containing protein [Actinomycetota bacterium]